MADRADQPLQERLRDAIRDVEDFPIPGVLFKDISPLLADPTILAAVVEGLSAAAGAVDKVVGIEARGFVLAAPVAYRCRAGFVPVRKEGKLPSATFSTPCELEYGSAVLEVHRDAFRAGDRVLVVDDVLATGGTAAAAMRLVEQAGAAVGGIEVVGVAFLLELVALSGREALLAAHPGVHVHALMTC